MRSVFMNHFYDVIAEYYDTIFPIGNEQRAFLDTIPSHNAKILDVGCATGSITHYLAQKGAQLTGIDLDNKMVDIANLKSTPDSPHTPGFNVLDMRKAGDFFSPDTFHTILCLGNTLVHLSNIKAISDWLVAIIPLLKKGGSF